MSAKSVLTTLRAPVRFGRDHSAANSVPSNGLLNCHGNERSAQADAMLAAHQVVDLEGVLAQVRVVRVGADPVRGPLLESRASEEDRRSAARGRWG